MLLFPELAADDLNLPDGPHHEVETGEKVLGQVDDAFNQQLFRYMMLYMRKMQEERIRGEYEGDQQASENAIRFRDQCDVFKELFFLAVKQETGIWNKNIGIRTGWKLVEMKKPEMPDFMRKMLGGGE